MIDVDHFKLFNDTYGHPEGDACLTRLGETLSGIAADTMGFAGRYGGEEFCLLLPNTDAAARSRSARWCARRSRDLAMPHATSSHQTVTVSVGVACTQAERHAAARRPDRGRGRRPLCRQTPRPQRRGRARLCAVRTPMARIGAGELSPRPVLRFEIVLGHDPVAAAFLGEIERAIAAIDQIRHRLAELKLSDADRHRDAGKHLAGRAAGDTALRDRAANTLGNRRSRWRDQRREARRSVLPRRIEPGDRLPERVRATTLAISRSTWSPTPWPKSSLNRLK